MLLCDVDGNLFASEEPAFEVSTEVINAFLSSHGVQVTLEAGDMRAESVGRSFRHTLAAVASQFSAELGDTETERWVVAERKAVTARLASALQPDQAVMAPLVRLARQVPLATVSSSAAERIAVCLEVAGLSGLFPAERRFSAEDSLDEPASKPDPAVYLHACRRLGVDPAKAVAVEDSLPGVLSAVGAGIPTIGNVQFVKEGERDGRRAELLRAGAASVVESWDQLELALFPSSLADGG